jgi:hypothetical protein
MNDKERIGIKRRIATQRAVIDNCIGSSYYLTVKIMIRRAFRKGRNQFDADRLPFVTYLHCPCCRFYTETIRHNFSALSQSRIPIDFHNHTSLPTNPKRSTLM